MSGFENLAIELGKEIGVPLTVKYGPRLLKAIKPRSIKLTKLHSTIVFTFYERLSYDRAFSLLSRALDNFRERRNNKLLLKFKDVTFEYQISITPAQDFGLLADVLEDQYRSLIFPDFEEKGQGVIFVSSARLFLWPVLPSEEISINHFKTILDVEYQLYRSVDSFLLEEVKSGVIGANKSFFILSIEIPDYRKVNKMLLEVPKDKVHVRDHVADILIDDSMIISLLVKSLR